LTIFDHILTVPAEFPYFIKVSMGFLLGLRKQKYILFLFLEGKEGQRKGEGENLKQAPRPVWS